MSSSWLWQPFGSCFCSIMVPTSHSGLENSVEQPYSWKRLRIHAWKHWCWPHCIGDPLYWDWDPGHRDRATGTGPPGPGHRTRPPGPGHRDRGDRDRDRDRATAIKADRSRDGTGPLGHQNQTWAGRDRDRATGPRQKKGARHGTGPPGPGAGTGPPGPGHRDPGPGPGHTSPDQTKINLYPSFSILWAYCK